MSGICTVVDDRLYFYYSGRADRRGPGLTGVAFLRRDGFASMDAGAQGGTLTTRPIPFNGSYLFVNAQSPAGLRAGSKLYSFWITSDKRGASHGYVAAGGPGFAGNFVQPEGK